MPDIDFKQIVARRGSRQDSFEELCCQLARLTLSKTSSFKRLHGSGGDGGVECYVDTPEGRMGWQAKYVYDVGSLLTQASKSLKTALAIHPSLTCYVVCFPFDLTGPTGRKGKSGHEKFDQWKDEQETNALNDGRKLVIEAWPAFKLKSLFLEYDSSGGIREFFFNQTILTNEWFSSNIERAKKTAGPRYTPELNVNTDLWKWLSAFGRTDNWSIVFTSMLKECKKANERLSSTFHESKSGTMPPWPKDLFGEVQELESDAGSFITKCNQLIMVDTYSNYEHSKSELETLISRFADFELRLTSDFETTHGRGTADSKGFRQFMAEYQCSFPAANIDRTRDLLNALRGFYDWLSSPACSLAFSNVFVLSGKAGSGKTHGICDASDRRASVTLHTCISFGHEFRGEPDPWTRLSENLDLPHTLGMNGILDALNAAGEASAYPLLLCIDAINETRPLKYWRERLSSVAQAVQSRNHLRLCITCRTPFIPFCVPDGFDAPIVEYLGFQGMEREACMAFFTYYGIAPPILPILQPELSNPLYLGLICKTLHSMKLKQMPSGWHGISQAIRAFINEKEKQFAVEYETSAGAKIVSGCLQAIAHEIAKSGDSAISWSQAQKVITAAKPQTTTLPVLEWLVRSELLIEDTPVSHSPLDGENMLRPSFERLGDFLVAHALLEMSQLADLDTEFQPNGKFHAFINSDASIERNSGVLTALSIIIPEQYRNSELPDFAKDKSVYNALLKISVQGLPSRDPESFTSSTERMIRTAFGMTDFSNDTMDAVLSNSWLRSAIDAIWLDELLNEIPLAKRDAYWCGYLHFRYESHGVVRRLIDAAFELPLAQLDEEIAERWSIVLLWFTAAADLRVKDYATRAAIEVLTAQPNILPNVLRRLISCDDDSVRERALLSCYGSLIILQDTAVLKRTADMLHTTFTRDPELFGNALVRDHIRCILELARELNALPDSCDPMLTAEPMGSPWPLELPTDDQVDTWGGLLHFRPDDFHSDFFSYSMNCLSPWEHGVSKTDMGKWILMRAVRDLGYEGSGCEQYDRYMLGKHGNGRAKETWAERIGKKYQWICLYQLASRLHDHIHRNQNSWEPKPLIKPLILLEERKFDPTLPWKVSERERRTGNWWIGPSVDFGHTEKLTDAEWISSKTDVPSIEKFISPIDHNGQTWRLLVSYPSWTNRQEDAGWNDPYRYMRIFIQSYLVRKEDLNTAYNCLLQRNLFGGWMPDGASWVHGFAGEYPWASAFNIESDEYNGRGGFRGVLPVIYEPTWNQLAVEWKYDSSILSYFHMFVPARNLFKMNDLWWNGENGYKQLSGKTVFCDPSVTESGHKALLVDANNLQERLKKLDLCLIWTLLGEKLIMNGSEVRKTFSQVACLNENGSLRIGKLVFFENYDQDTGPGLVKDRRRPKQ